MWVTPDFRLPAGTKAKTGAIPKLHAVHGRLAQLGERLPYKEDVGGSSPSSPTIHYQLKTTRPLPEAFFHPPHVLKFFAFGSA